MLHHVYKLVTDFDRLQFGAGVVGHSGFIKRFFTEATAKNNIMRATRKNTQWAKVFYSQGEVFLYFKLKLLIRCFNKRPFISTCCCTIVVQKKHYDCKIFTFTIFHQRIKAFLASLKFWQICFFALFLTALLPAAIFHQCSTLSCLTESEWFARSRSFFFYAATKFY